MYRTADCRSAFPYLIEADTFYSTASSEDGCAPAERTPTRPTEVVRLEIAKLSIESGVSLVDIVCAACQRTAET